MFTLSIDFNDEEEAIINKINSSSNINPKTRPSNQEFLISDIKNRIQSFKDEETAQQLRDIQNKFNQVISNLTAQDLLEVLAVAEKYQ
jgi:Mg2+ and Co2+ transporter CorA